MITPTRLLTVSLVCFIAAGVCLGWLISPMASFYAAVVLTLFALGVVSGHLYDLMHVRWLRWQVDRELRKIAALIGDSEEGIIHVRHDPNGRKNR